MASSTGDVDTLNVRPASQDENIQTAAAMVGQEMSLQANWLNFDAGLYRSSLPDGWEGRRQLAISSGRLRAYAVNRLDLIVMKFIAHRTGDREQLREMNIKSDELKVVRDYLVAMSDRIEQGVLDRALFYIDRWFDNS